MQIVGSELIYATDKEWLGTLTKPAVGEVYIMSENGVFSATCEIGSLKDGDGNPIPVPEGLWELQQKFCICPCMDPECPK